VHATLLAATLATAAFQLSVAAAPAAAPTAPSAPCDSMMSLKIPNATIIRLGF